MSFVYCRVRPPSDRCMGVAAFDVENLVNRKVDGWQDVDMRVGANSPQYEGVCPACIAASKPREKRVISGGTVFDPVELEAGGRVVVDRQKSLFGDE